ncbi:MAG: hypothetical protein VW683_16330 [Betaproteobacteria bacterium]|jgi:hypothetical protein
MSERYDNFKKLLAFHQKNLDTFDTIENLIKNNIELGPNEKQFLKNFEQLYQSIIQNDSLNSNVSENQLSSEITEQQSLKEIQKSELEKIRKETKTAEIETADLEKMSGRILSLQNRLEKITNERSIIEIEIKNQISQLSEQREKQREIIKQLLSYYQN